MINTFLKYLQYEKRYSAHTLVSYQTDISQFINFLENHYPELTVVTADYRTLRSWIVSLVEAQLDSRSVNRKMASLRTFYKYLLLRGHISINPTLKLKALKTTKKLPHFVNEDDLARVFDHIQYPEGEEGARDALILELLYGTGIRLSELIELKHENLSLTQQTIKVLGKRNKERIIPFSNALKRVIENYLTTQKATDKSHVIVDQNGQPLYPMFVYRTVRKYLAAANVDKRSPHVLRHTFATHLLNKGAELNAVKELLGHSSLAATQVYTHNTMDKMKKVFDQAHPKA